MKIKIYHILRVPIICLRGTDDDLVETGVYGRYFENIYPDYLLNLPEAPPAVQIGGVGDIIFTGN